MSQLEEMFWEAQQEIVLVTQNVFMKVQTQDVGGQMRSENVNIRPRTFHRADRTHAWW